MSTGRPASAETPRTRYREVRAWSISQSANNPLKQQIPKLSLVIPSPPSQGNSYSPSPIATPKIDQVFIPEDYSDTTSPGVDRQVYVRSDAGSSLRKKTLRTSFSVRQSPSRLDSARSEIVSAREVSDGGSTERTGTPSVRPRTNTISANKKTVDFYKKPPEVWKSQEAVPLDQKLSSVNIDKGASEMLRATIESEFRPAQAKNPTLQQRLASFRQSFVESVNSSISHSLNQTEDPYYHQNSVQQTSPEAESRNLCKRITSKTDHISDEEFIQAFEESSSFKKSCIVKDLLSTVRRLDQLLDASKSISFHSDHLECLKKIMDEACDFLRADCGAIYAVDHAKSEIVKKASSRRCPDFAHKVPFGKGILGIAASTGRSFNIPDAYADARFDVFEDKNTGYLTKNILCTCVKDTQGHNMAVIQLKNKKASGEGFTEDDERALEIFASHAASSIRFLQLQESSHKDQEKVSVLLEISRQMESSLDLNSLCQLIMVKSRDLLSADRCTLYLVDKEKNELYSKFADRQGGIRIPMGVGISGYVATSGQTLNIKDAYDDPRFNSAFDKKTGYRTKAILCMPIRNPSDEIIGVTQMINKLDGGCFTQEDENLLLAFSSQASVSLMNSQYFEKTKEMQHFLESILSSITNLVIVLNADGFMLKANHPTGPFLGIDEKVMMEASYVTWLGPKNEIFLNAIRDVYLQSKSGYFSDCEFYLPSEADAESKTKNVNFNVVPLVASEGTRSGVVIVIEDVTPQKRLHSTLGRYMSPALADEIMKKDSKLQLGGKHMKVTTIFCDIRKFTSISEKLDAAEVVDLLNEYFSHMVNAIFAERGILDKYIGDALMAVFGVPMTEEDDSYRACRAALQMISNLSAFNQSRSKQGYDLIQVGIGINTGRVLSGNIGTERRLEYTVIGDGVNIASRIEGVTKQYGITIMISETTYEEVSHHFVTRELDLIRVVGKKQPIRVYELIRENTTPPGSDNIDEAVKLFSQGLEFYRNREFLKASSLFESADRARVGGDPPSRVFLERCGLLVQNSPEDGWDRVWNMDSK